ncbi:MAG TPA: nuclear transport factor 2 family protein, partial [Chloroflexota bacterium]|nr:nuclear transport factor 2 family protein [Chloroflexota bacterium]
MPSFSEEQALVADANVAFYRAVESLDFERLQSVWLHSDDVKCIHPGWELMSGWEQVMRSWSLIFENTARIRFELSDVQVVVNGGIGWVECLERIYDGESVVGEAIATNLFQQNPDGRWLMLHHHAS